MAMRMPPSGFVDFYSLQPRLIWAHERDVEPQFRTGATSGGSETVCWLLQRGRVIVEDEGSRVAANRGEWMFLRSRRGTQRFSDDARVLSIHFRLHFHTGEALFVRRRTLVFPARAHPGLGRAAAKLAGQLRAASATAPLLVGRDRLGLAANLRIESAFHAWLAAYVEFMLASGEKIQTASPRDRRVALAIRLIHEHSMREKFSEKALAGRCGLSVNQLLRLFRLETGQTPKVYYEAKRQELARHALAETTMAVKEIAFDLGFGSTPHFSGWFRARQAMSPLAFRRLGKSRGTPAARTGRPRASAPGGGQRRGDARPRKTGNSTTARAGNRITQRA